jgi:MFS transporter, Spinster family, sphingosine-1-phosphate transporter
MHPPTSESVESPGPMPRSGGLPTIGGKYFALGVLFAMNLLNYVDRYSFFGVGTQIRRDFDIDNFWYSVLGVSFMIVYSIVSPFVGWLGDRYHRRRLLAGGVALWSFATLGTAFSHDFWHIFFWRSLLGVGEASYGVIAPTLIADLFPVKERGRAMGIYYLALPLGGALGYGVGSWIGQDYGWRAAFWVVGLPGLVAAAAGLVMNDPGRGASERKAHRPDIDRPDLAPSEVELDGDALVGVDSAAKVGASKSGRPELRDYFRFFLIPTFVLNTLGMAAVTFATGAYAVHGSNFYQDVRGMTMKDAGLWIGGLTAVAGLVGIALGTFLADLFRKMTRRAYMLLAFVVVAGSVPLGCLAILEPKINLSLILLFGAMVLLSMVLGPCNTVIANVLPANKRASGYAVYILMIHLLGDISSPLILGLVSGWFGDPSMASSSIGRYFASIGAGPVGKENLTVAMLSVVPVLALGAIFFLLGSKYLPRDEDRAVSAGGDSADAEGRVYYH